MNIDYGKIFKNYNFINEYYFDKDDYISDMLIKNYRTLIYNIDINNKLDLRFAKKIDNIMNLYIIDTDFYKNIHECLNDFENNNIQDLNQILIEEYEKYQQVLPVITTSRWI